MDKDTYELILSRIDDQTAATLDVKRTVEEGFKAMNGRVRTSEQDIVKIKTTLGIFSGITGFILGWVATHWPGVQKWLTMTP